MLIDYFQDLDSNWRERALNELNESELTKAEGLATMKALISGEFAFKIY